MGLYCDKHNSTLLHCTLSQQDWLQCMWWVQAGSARHLSLTKRLLLHILPMLAGEPVPPRLLHDHCLHLLAAISWFLGAACHLLCKAAVLHNACWQHRSQREQQTTWPARLQFSAELNALSECGTLLQELKVRILLPGLKGAAQITLDVEPKSVSARVAGKYRLDALPLPYEVDAERFRAPFNIDKQALQLTLPVLPPPGTSTRHPAQAERTSAAQPERLAAELLAARPGGNGSSKSGSEVGTLAREQDAAAASVAPHAAEAAATACGHRGAEVEAHSQQAASQMKAAVKGSAEASRAGASDTDSCCDDAHPPAPAKANPSASSAAWPADGHGRQPQHGAPEALSAESNSTTLDQLDAGPPAQHVDNPDGLTENERVGGSCTP